jgi:hypothetical protein
MTLVRYADRPDLRARRFAELSGVTFPQYMHHNEPGNRFWGRLYSDYPDFQVATSSWRRRTRFRSRGMEPSPISRRGGRKASSAAWSRRSRRRR